ncbi:MAG TPA: hypothetical protein VHG28_19235 [Longimicrobiaceae bacterium]|nr:hypothetical protein [Longimicrobiaceae bacterium]
MATPKKGGGGPRNPTEPPRTLAETRTVEAVEGPTGTFEDSRKHLVDATDQVAVNTGTIATEIGVGTERIVGELARSAGMLTTSAERLAGATERVVEKLDVLPRLPGLASGDRSVTLRRAELENTEMGALWTAIAIHTEAISFASYDAFMTRILCVGASSAAPASADPMEADLRTQMNRLQRLCHLPGVDAYELLKTATETFLLLECGACPPAGGGAGLQAIADPVTGARDPKAVVGPEFDRFGRSGDDLTYDEARSNLAVFLGNARNNYLETIIQAAFPRGQVNVRSPFCLASGTFLDSPCLLELIWSYWMEEGMLTQTISTITRRFQNVRRPGRGPDPLAEFELDPLRPLNGFIWGYLQDEPNRLSVVRRAYEYNHHYGLTLYGRAVPRLRPADPRSRFLEAFHNLLRQAAEFYREDNDTTVIADAFPVLNSLKEVHLVLSEGAHNQFRDLPWTARVEMLLQQWLLARPEMREFLRGRYMVAYPERWMGPVDSMKKLQGWTETSVIHFRDLARFGERILLSIRYGNWSAVSDQDHAKAWLRFWKEEIQGYIHAYHAATGVNLTDDAVEVRRSADIRYLQPSVHLRNRLLAERRAKRLTR